MNAKYLMIPVSKFCVLEVMMTCLFVSCAYCKKKEVPDKVQIIKEFSLQKEKDSLYYLNVIGGKVKDNWTLSYPVYRFCVGDVDQNGRNDALIGVIKKTRFDSLERKRLFIFKNYEGLIRPLWLGSRLGQPIVDFTFVKTNEGARIRSVEKEKSGKFLVAEYKWRKFGVEFTKYIKKEIDSVSAIKLLKLTQ